jgi:hypothetical protein
MHPLAPSLHELSMDELTTKYSELQKRMNQAYRFGPQSIIPQIQMMMEHYQAELNERNRKQLEDMNKKANDTGKGYKGIIDIS